MKIMGVVGGSGRWTGWEVEEITGRLNTAVKTGRVFSGHVPKHVKGVAWNEAVTRQIARQAAWGVGSAGPKGGHIFELDIDESSEMYQRVFRKEAAEKESAIAAKESEKAEEQQALARIQAEREASIKAVQDERNAILNKRAGEIAEKYGCSVEIVKAFLTRTPFDHGYKVDQTLEEFIKENETWQQQ